MGLSATLAATDEEWVTIARFELANYALNEASDAPVGVYCTRKGKEPKSCHCWNPKGHPEEGGSACDEPTGCLIYTTSNDGKLTYGKVNSTTEVRGLLEQWNVPPNMTTNFNLALLTENATFTTFDFVLKSELGHYEAHVGTARLNQGEYFVGYVFGNASGDLISPRKRVTPSPCRGEKQKKRGFTDDEIDEIVKGLGAVAFSKAADTAQPTAMRDTFFEAEHDASGLVI